MTKKVRIVKEYHNDRELFGELSQQEFLIGESVYNEDGKLLSITSYFKDELPEQRISNEYDSKGRLISETVEYLLEDVSEKTLFEYDDKDRITQEKKVYADGTFDLVTHSFDDPTHTSTTVKIDADGEIERKEIIVHDAEGNVISSSRFDGNDTELHKEKFEYNDKKKLSLHWVEDSGGNVYVYDENDVLLQVKHLNEKGNEISNEQYLTDERGNVIGVQQQNHMQGGSHLALESQYDENDRLILKIHFTPDGTPERRDSFVYDEEGRVIEETHFHLETQRGMSEHFTRRFEYEFY